MSIVLTFVQKFYFDQDVKKNLFFHFFCTVVAITKILPIAVGISGVLQYNFRFCTTLKFDIVRL